MSLKNLSILILIFSSLIILSFISLKDTSGNYDSGARDVRLQFIVYNGYGNNLYIDNVLTGERISNDVTVTSIVNIPPDTVYSVFSSGSDTVSPVVSVANIGNNNSSDTLRVYLNINPGNFLFDTAVSGLSPGQTLFIRFPVFSYSIGTPYYIKAYVSDQADSNYINDTLYQYNISLPGFRRNVLYEEFTSNASPACANNNSFLNIFSNTNIQSVNTIVYHTGILGNDTFYTYNPEQNDARRRFYFIAGVPTTFVDGVLSVAIPYGDSVNLYTPYRRRYNRGTPVSVNVSDEFIGDSVRSTINVNVISPLPEGDYRLRINAVERYKTNVSAINGETEFYDIFRRMYPDTTGFIITLSPGNYEYSYTYYKDPVWNDSMLYTSVFIQDDNFREIINSAKSREIIINPVKPPPALPYSNKSDLFNCNFADFINYNFPVTGTDSVFSALNVELFEAVFPPLNWKVFNRDGFITFDQYIGANGPTISGLRSAYINLFNYNIIGQRDSMYSKVYDGLLQTDSIEFDYAYAQYNSSNIDSLIVKISTDGGQTFPAEIFRRGGLQLATAPQTSSSFVPQNNTQWRKFSFSLQDIVSVNNGFENVPSGFRLSQNFPNPFNPATKINFDLPVSGNVSIKVYDITGKEIFVIINEFVPAGAHTVDFNPTEKGLALSSGVYFYKLISAGFADTKRMILLK